MLRCCAQSRTAVLMVEDWETKATPPGPAEIWAQLALSPMPGTIRPRQFGPEQAKRERLRLGAHGGMEAALADLGVGREAVADHHGGPGPPLAQRPDGVRNRRRRAADHGEVGDDRQGRHVRVGENAGDGLVVAGDRHDRPLEPTVQQVVHDQMAGHALLVAGADDGDRARVEHLVEVADRHCRRRCWSHVAAPARTGRLVPCAAPSRCRARARHEAGGRTHHIGGWSPRNN